MLIARKGNFGLQHCTYIGTEAVVYNFELEIVKYEQSRNGHETCYTIASFESIDGDGYYELMSCGDRLLKAMETQEDLDAVKLLESIALKIFQTDNFEVKR